MIKGILVVHLVKEKERYSFVKKNNHYLLKRDG